MITTLPQPQRQIIEKFRSALKIATAGNVGIQLTLGQGQELDKAIGILERLAVRQNPSFVQLEEGIKRTM